MVELEKKKSDETTWAMLCHLSSLSSMIGIPFGNILGPLIIWLIKKEESSFVDQQGRESLNFQISLFIYGFGALVLSLVIFGLIFVTVIANEEIAFLIPIFFVIIFVVFILIWIITIILTIIASIQAKSGRKFRYPFIFRFL